MTKYFNDILNQPAQLQQSLQYSITKGKPNLHEAAELIKKSKHIFISAIGASWCAGLAIQAAFNQVGVQAVLWTSIGRGQWQPVTSWATYNSLALASCRATKNNTCCSKKHYKAVAEPFVAEILQ